MTEITPANTRRGKMVWILLLLGLTCSVIGLKMSPTIYQPEEDDNVTIHWDTKNKTDLSHSNLDCFLQSKTQSSRVFYRMINGVDVPESQHQQFAGRVQVDRNALREGQIRLHLSTVTAEDSGDCWCHMTANYDKNKKRWELITSVHFVLNVVKNSHGDIRHTLSATPGLRRSHLGDLCTTLSVITAVGGAATLLGFLVLKICKRSQRKDSYRERILIELLLWINLQREQDINESVV